jgi:hypothetical protein
MCEMKKMMLFLFVVVNIPSYSQMSIADYKVARDMFINFKLKNEIGNTFSVETNNRKNDREITLEYVIVSINTDDTIINEFNQKIKYQFNKRIYSEEDLLSLDNYQFVNAHFIDYKTGKPYQTTYNFNHNNIIKKFNYEICYKIKTVNGRKRKLNYLHIITY